MPVPVLNIQAFSADEIFSNGLFLIIPFYSIRFEYRLKRISRKPSKKFSKKRIEKIKASNKAEYDRIYTELSIFLSLLSLFPGNKAPGNSCCHDAYRHDAFFTIKKQQR